MNNSLEEPQFVEAEIASKNKKEKKQPSIEETLWDPANKLRDSVEPGEYKHGIR